MRFRIAQSWWIASEIMRRHEGLKLIETHPGGGQYDCLSIVSLRASASETVIDLNRSGSIHIKRPAAGMLLPPKAVTWSDVLARGGPRDMVEQLEADADLGPAPAKTRTSASTVGLRLIAELLTRGVNDREAWDARSEYEDTSGYGGGPRGFVEKFQGSRVAGRERRPDDLLGIPGYRYWGLVRGASLAAVVDTDGNIHSDAGTFDLMAMYRARGRSWLRTVDDAMRAAGLQ